MKKLILAAVPAALAVGCTTDIDSPTELNPEGPPMIRQVIMTEQVTTSTGTSTNTPALAFGTHPDFDSYYADDDGRVTNSIGASQKVMPGSPRMPSNTATVMPMVAA